jgi:hypothetical protein
MPITDGNGSTIEPAGGWRILANSTARKTINLDNAPTSVRKISIEDTVGDAGANNVTINAASGQTIDGSASIVLDANNQRKVLESTGTGWTVIDVVNSTQNTIDSGDLIVDGVTIRNAFAFPTSDGTNGQVLKTDGNGTLSWENDATGSGGGSVSSSDLTSSVVHYNELYDENYTTNYQQGVSHTRKYHIDIPQKSANTWSSIFSWRPLDATNPGVELGSSTYYGAVGYTIKIFGKTGGVAGGCVIIVRGHVSYVGGNVAWYNTDDVATWGNVPSFRIHTSNWTSTIQINPNSTGQTFFLGGAYIELHLGRGAGNYGESVYWDIDTSP